MLPILTRAISESLAFSDEGPKVIGLAILGALVTALIVLAVRGRDGLKKHIIENVLIVFGGAVATWLLVFSWFLLYKVPQEIRTQATHTSAPHTGTPTPPTFAFVKYGLSHQTSKTEPKPSEPKSIIVQTQAPYGNLAARCDELGSEIISSVEQRNKVRPDPATHREEYKEW